MKRFGWQLLAVSSVIVAALAAAAETRPQYGGTLHVAMRAAPASLDPADDTQPDSFARRSLTMLVFDTLVTMDESGRVQPALAASWAATSPAAGNQRWQFHIRRGVRFHDGTALSAEVAAASLRAANPAWNLSADGDTVVIERAEFEAELLAELALPRNAIVKRNAGGPPSGTGLFHVADWQAGKKLTLAADENCWRGRPFLDTIEIEMGKSFREQMTELEVGATDLVEVTPEQAHGISRAGRRLASTASVELLALVFSRDAASPEEKLLREALAWSVERGSIRSVLLQGAGQPAASILPNRMSGYGFVFSTDADLAQARQAREQAHATPIWTLSYDASDSLDRLLAERIALNAKDAGLTLQPTPSANADVRLVRIPLASPDPWVALANVATLAGAPARKSGGSIEELYATERVVLEAQRVIPLFHLPVSYAATAALRDWTLRPDGSWALADAWLETGKP